MRYFYAIDNNDNAAIIMASSKQECLDLFSKEFINVEEKRVFIENWSFQFTLNQLTSNKENVDQISFSEARDLLEDNQAKVIAVYGD